VAALTDILSQSLCSCCIVVWCHCTSGMTALLLTHGVLQVPATDGPAFLLDNFKRRPLVVVRAIMSGIHDALRRSVKVAAPTAGVDQLCSMLPHRPKHYITVQCTTLH
jgi:hypothetical protein